MIELLAQLLVEFKELKTILSMKTSSSHDMAIVKLDRIIELVKKEQCK